jgi:hypothetical protein
MTLHEYEQSREIEIQGYPFYALIMAAMRQADTYNAEKLRNAFPEVWDEFVNRYHAPGGLLEKEREQ